jgi:hypothetical protein
MKVKIRLLIIEGLKVTGNFDDALSYIEENLTIGESKDVASFFEWCEKNGKTIGHGNIADHWKAFKGE